MLCELRSLRCVRWKLRFSLQSDKWSDGPLLLAEFVW